MGYRHTVEVEIVDPFDGSERMSPQTLLKALEAAVGAIEELGLEAEIGDMRVVTWQDSDGQALPLPVVNNVTVMRNADDDS